MTHFWRVSEAYVATADDIHRAVAAANQMWADCMQMRLNGERLCATLARCQAQADTDHGQTTQEAL